MRGRVIHIALVALSLGVLSACHSEQDPFLRSLKLSVEHLQAVDSINLDAIGLFSPDAVAVTRNHQIILSSIQGDHNLMIVNPITKKGYPAIKRGRGPGEMVLGSSLHKSAPEITVYYDYYAGVCVSVAAKEDADEGRIVLDTIAHFDAETGKPVYLAYHDGRFLSGNALDADVWYSVYDERGAVRSSIPGLNYPQLRQRGESLRSSVHLSSKYTIKPDGKKCCVASVASPSLSFATLDGYDAVEYNRLEYGAPALQQGHDAFSPENRSAFYGLVSDDKAVYLLYSGHQFQDTVIPVNSCTHLLVYDWDGTLKRHFELDQYVNSLALDGDRLVACSSYPAEMVYYFDIP